MRVNAKVNATVKGRARVATVATAAVHMAPSVVATVTVTGMR